MITNSVSREGVTLKRVPQDEFSPGTIFAYTGSLERLKGYVLIHEINPVLSSLSQRDGKPVIAENMVKAEVLIPENGYRDCCLFWIEKRHLSKPTAEQYSLILSKIKA